MTATTNSLQALYCQLMAEIKERIEIFQCCADDVPKLGVAPQRAFELCYLQLRFICETIALASLAAHGDVWAGKASKLRKSYKPGVIVDEMLRLHPDFYPRSCRQKLNEHGRLVGWTPAPDPLTQRELKALWNHCGDHLHRGSIERIDQRKPLDIGMLTRWHNKILRMLNIHIIHLVDKKTAFFVALSSDPDGQIIMSPMDRFGDAYSPRDSSFLLPRAGSHRASGKPHRPPEPR